MSKLIFLALALTFAVALACDPGYFKEFEPHTHQSHCDECERGFYCPGNDQMLPCPHNHISNETRATECIKCPPSQPTSSQSRTYCMFSDTPSDIRFSNINNIESIVILNGTNHFTQEFAMNTNSYTILMLIGYKNLDNKLIAYGSQSTGNPSSTNYEEKSNGKNILLAIPHTTHYVPYYYTVYSNIEQNAVQAVTLQSYYDRIIVSDAEEFSLHAKVADSYLFFSTFEEFNIGDRVNLTAITFGQDASCEQTLYYCEDDPYQEYPNDYLGCKVAEVDKPAKSATTTYVTKPRTIKGKIYFAVFPYCSYSKTDLMMQVLISKRK